MNRQVEELQEQVQQAALNLNQLHMTSNDYGKNITCVHLLMCTQVLSLYIYRNETATN